jgi:hypothetical protein
MPTADNGIVLRENRPAAMRSCVQDTQKLLGVRTLDKAVEVQTGYAKAAYERFLAQTAKVGGLYVEHARPVFGPFEGLAAFSVKTPTAPAR